MGQVIFRPARPAERLELEALQRRASLALEDYRDALLAHPDAIELPLDLIRNGDVIVAQGDGRPVGFASVIGDAEGTELEGLFVDPPFWRQGIGMALVEQAFALAISRGATTMRLIANPEVLSFYEKAGFVLKGETPTRFGPALLMQRQLSPVPVSGAAGMRT